MEKRRNRTKRERKPVDKRKMIQSIIVIVLCTAMVLSVAASLIYALLVQ